MLTVKGHYKDFSVMQECGISQAFTSDHHFAQAGFTCLL